MLALTKTCLYLGSVLLVGAGVFTRLINGRVLVSPRVLCLGVVGGAAVLWLGSALDIVLTLRGVLGRADWPLVYDYLGSTRHGRAVVFRSVLVGLVAGLTVLKRRGWVNGLLGALSLLLLASFSWTSHAAAVGGAAPLLIDLIHFSAAAAWGGSILYLAASRQWSTPELSERYTFSLTRVSQLGLVSVAALGLTGVYSGLLHLSDPASFVRSPYGFALYAKLAFVALSVAVAALNRFKLLPLARRTGRHLGFRNSLRAEALLIVLILAATGVLSTSALPHGPDASNGVLENATRLFTFLRTVLRTVSIWRV